MTERSRYANSNEDDIDSNLLSNAQRLVVAYAVSVALLIGAIVFSYIILRGVIATQQQLNTLKVDVNNINLAINDSVSVVTDYRLERRKPNPSSRLLDLIKARVISTQADIQAFKQALEHASTGLETSPAWPELSWITDSSEGELHWKLESYLLQLNYILTNTGQVIGDQNMQLMPVDAAGAKDAALSHGYEKASNQLSSLIDVYSQRIESLHRMLTILVVGSMLLLSILVVTPLWRRLIGEHRRLQSTHSKLRQIAFFDRVTGLPNLDGLEKNTQPLTNDRTVKGGQHLLLVRITNTDELYNLIGSHRAVELHQLFAKRLLTLEISIDQWSRSSEMEYTSIIDNTIAENSKDWATNIHTKLTKPLTVNGVVVRPTLTLAISKIEPFATTTGSVFWEHQSRARVASLQFDPTICDIPKYDASQTDRLTKQNQLITEISEGIGNREFIPYYQVKVDAQTGLPSSLEALCRWQKCSDKLMNPDEFIPAAEHSGQIVAMTYLLLDQVVEDINSWSDQGLFVERVAINIAGDLLHHNELPQMLAAHLARLPKNCAGLELEITENILLGDNLEKISDTLTTIRNMGIKVSIDDFGTGYASLQTLIELPFDILKLDKAFVHPMKENGNGSEIVSAMISLSNKLHKACVVEGIENQWQWDQLRTMGADELQGYYFHQPSDAESTLNYLIKAKNTIKAA